MLAEKSIPYISHEMTFAPSGEQLPSNYLPGYVRLRLAAMTDKPLVQGFTGQSSVDSEGFDPCVVPTLVDHEKARVVVDSAYICEYLDREAGAGNRLIPDDLADPIAKQIHAVDQAPHVAVLYGAHPGKDPRPQFLAQTMEGIHDKKIRALKALREQMSDDPALVRAYDAKIAKEEDSKAFVHDPAKMRDAIKRMADHVRVLEQSLHTHDQQWGTGNRYTMADIMWTVSLYRMKRLGLGYIWEHGGEMPRVCEYVGHAFERPSFQQAVTRWPGAYPSSPPPMSKT